jgi:gamma-glutamyltranspeptidase/glutathione hydrolase
MARTVPFHPTAAARGMVCAADQVAASAGVAMLAQGGNAADAAVATATAMAVVAPHLCGLGGDMLAMVHAPGQAPLALLGVGRAGSGADPERLRRAGHRDMPVRGDVSLVPVPGAVDGWLALHERFGRLAWATVLEPARALAAEGFAASIMLALATSLVADVPGAQQLCPDGPLEIGAPVRLPGVARTLEAIAADGRTGFYEGEFGDALLALGAGEYTSDDLSRPLAQWVEPLHLGAFGHELWTVPPPSQGYLTLAGAWIAEYRGLPADPDDPCWPHLIAESARAAGGDRFEVLHEGADGEALLAPERLEALAHSVDRDRVAADLGAPEGVVSGAHPSPDHGDHSVGAADRPATLSSDGDTTHLCTADAEGLGVSITQSNAQDFGAHLVAGETGVFLHNRGMGFTLDRGHPAEYGPGRRPTHTLSPALVTRPDGTLAQVIGTMGGDHQPQILLQLLARLLVSGENPARAIRAPRVVLDAPGAPPFRLWSAPERSLLVEGDAPGSWVEGLEARGHRVRTTGPLNPVDVGCSQIISVGGRDGGAPLRGASDPRSPEGAALGW